MAFSVSDIFITCENSIMDDRNTAVMNVARYGFTARSPKRYPVHLSP